MGNIVDRRCYLLGIQLRDNLFCFTCMAKERLASLPQVKLVQNPLSSSEDDREPAPPRAVPGNPQPQGLGGHPAS